MYSGIASGSTRSLVVGVGVPMNDRIRCEIKDTLNTSFPMEWRDLCHSEG